MKTMCMLRMKKKIKDPSTTGWAISALGLLVSTLGARMIDRKLGAGILGFGLAHILLGQLDRYRPTIRRNSWY